MSVTAESAEYRPEKPEIPKGWSPNFSEFIIEPENPEKYLSEGLNCYMCGSPMSFINWDNGNTLVGDDEHTVFLVLRGVPRFRCEPCDLETDHFEAFNEVDRKALVILKELGVR